MEDEAIYGTTALEKMLAPIEEVELIISIDPMGAVRTTGKQMYKDERYKRYNEWKRSFYWLVIEASKKVGHATSDFDWEDILYVEFGMPVSQGKKYQERIGQPHKMKPDIDNMLKAVLDAMLTEDSTVHSVGGMRKVWAKEGYIKLRFRIS